MPDSLICEWRLALTLALALALTLALALAFYNGKQGKWDERKRQVDSFLEEDMRCGNASRTKGRPTYIPTLYIASLFDWFFAPASICSCSGFCHFESSYNLPKKQAETKTTKKKKKKKQEIEKKRKKIGWAKRKQISTKMSGGGKVQITFPQAILDKYEVNGITLGSGSFGEVKSGKIKADGKRVAFKLIRNVFHSSHDARRALREVSIMRQCNHPNIMRLVDIFTPGTATSFRDLWLVMANGGHDLSRCVSVCLCVCVFLDVFCIYPLVGLLGQPNSSTPTEARKQKTENGFCLGQSNQNRLEELVETPPRDQMLKHWINGFVAATNQCECDHGLCCVVGDVPMPM